MNLQSFKAIPREITFVRLLKSSELLSFGVLCNLIAKMHTITTSKFWLIKFMDANFFYYSIYDRFIQRQPGACMRVCMHVCIY